MVLAILSLGTILFRYSFSLKYLCLFFALVFLLLILFKMVKYPSFFKSDLDNPIIFSSFGTFSMSLMLLSTYLYDFFGFYSIILWILGIMLHLIILIVFTYRFVICDFNLNDVYGTWWIVYVGISMAAISSPIFGIKNIGYIFFLIGFSLMIPSFLLVTYRYLKRREISDANKPFMSIYTALFSILIVAYISSSYSINFLFLGILYFMHLISFIVSIVNLFKSRSIGFYPSFAAFSFPFVISAKASEFILNLKYNIIINYIFNFELIVAIFLVILISLAYIKYIRSLFYE
ncbi:MAG: hypothetical protein IJH34_11805 [Romboutsia sp.]|nr:hypothetical protein [Romboutsia sp.]